MDLEVEPTCPGMIHFHFGCVPLGCFQAMNLVPSKRVFGHDWGRDLLRPYTAPLAAAASSAATAVPTTRRQSSRPATASHEERAAALHRAICITATIGHRGYRIRALVCQPLVPIPPGNEEHGGAISNGTHYSSGSNTCTGRVNLVIALHVGPHRPAVL